MHKVGSSALLPLAFFIMQEYKNMGLHIGPREMHMSAKRSWVLQNFCPSEHV